MSEQFEVRRAKREDLATIASLVDQATGSRHQPDEGEVMGWLLSRGLWVALLDNSLVGVAAWQAENLVSVTDVFYISPDRLWTDAGSRLMETIEGEAKTLMCEVNAVLLPAWIPEKASSFFQQQGYESQAFADLHRYWREVLQDFVTGDSTLLVKRLRDRMVMSPP